MTTLDPLGVQIGAREIYDKVNDIDRKVDRLIDGHDGLRQDVAALRTVDADHEARLRTLERARWPLPSIAALMSIAAVVLAALGLFLKGG